MQHRRAAWQGNKRVQAAKTPLKHKPLSARGTDMGNRMGIDMGNTFRFICGLFHGHDVEKTLFCSATAAVREVGSEEPTKHVPFVSAFWNESQERLQVAAALRARGTAWFARSDLPAAPLAAADILGVVEPDSTFATPLPELGQQETGGSTAQRISKASRSPCANDRQMVETTEAESWSSAPLCGRATAQLRAADGCWAKQPRMDSGLQRLVSNRRWPARGTVDCPGCVQSLSPGGSFAQGSGWEAGAQDFSAAVSGEGLPQCHSRGQWRSLWIQGASWPDAIE